jgi:hypothetical protein
LHQNRFDSLALRIGEFVIAEAGGAGFRRNVQPPYLANWDYLLLNHQTMR